MTINGRVVDFPMKVGDAGEAFFVFETEQEVPEEFATSPLAGPSTPDKVEEIDFLDLAQGEERGGDHVTALPNEQGSHMFNNYTEQDVLLFTRKKGDWMLTDRVFGWRDEFT